MGRGDSALAGRLVFLVGCRRSGTNWLQRILTAHPDIVGMPSETYLFSGALAEVAERFQHANPGSPQTGKLFMSRDGMLDAMRDFADRAFAENLERLGPDARYLVERTPWHVYDVELIGDVYPDARIIHIIRDGRDVARSLLSQPWGPERMEEAAKEWRSSVVAGRSAGQALGPDRYVEVRYEALLESTEANVRGIYEWLGLDSSEDLMEQVLAEARSEFNVDPKAPVIASGKWRDAISASDLGVLEREAGDLLAELGYEPSDLPKRPLRRPVVSRRALSRHFSPRARQRPEVDHMEHDRSAYIVLEQFTGHIGAGRLDAAVGMLTPRAHVRVAANGNLEEARGAAAKQLLHDHLSSVPATDVVFGSVHPGMHTATSVTKYALPDGRTLARSLTVSATDGSVGSVSVFDFELADAHDQLLAQA